MKCYIMKIHIILIFFILNKDNLLFTKKESKNIVLNIDNANFITLIFHKKSKIN